MPIYETVHQVEGAASIFEYGFPESNVLILYERHVVCFDVQKRLAKWVAYKLEKDDIQGNSISVCLFYFKTVFVLQKPLQIYKTRIYKFVSVIFIITHTHTH